MKSRHHDPEQLYSQMTDVVSSLLLADRSDDDSPLIIPLHFILDLDGCTYSPSSSREDDLSQTIVSYIQNTVARLRQEIQAIDEDYTISFSAHISVCTHRSILAEDRNVSQYLDRRNKTTGKPYYDFNFLGAQEEKPEPGNDSPKHYLPFTANIVDHIQGLLRNLNDETSDITYTFFEVSTPEDHQNIQGIASLPCGDGFRTHFIPFRNHMEALLREAKIETQQEGIAFFREHATTVREQFTENNHHFEILSDDFEIKQREFDRFLNKKNSQLTKLINTFFDRLFKENPFAACPTFFIDDGEHYCNASHDIEPVDLPKGTLLTTIVYNSNRETSEKEAISNMKFSDTIIQGTKDHASRLNYEAFSLPATQNSISEIHHIQNHYNYCIRYNQNQRNKVSPLKECLRHYLHHSERNRAIGLFESAHEEPLLDHDIKEWHKQGYSDANLYVHIYNAMMDIALHHYDNSSRNDFQYLYAILLAFYHDTTLDHSWLSPPKDILLSRQIFFSYQDHLKKNNSNDEKEEEEEEEEESYTQYLSDDESSSESRRSSEEPSLTKDDEERKSNESNRTPSRDTLGSIDNDTYHLLYTRM